MKLILAFDFGLTYIGVAVGQPITASASGVTTLKCPKPRQAPGVPQWRQVSEIISEHRPGTIVVGLPLNMDGSESEMAVLAGAFAEQLRARFDLEVVLHDERLTSRAADELLDEAIALGRAQTTHEVAACLILESWFSAHQKTT